jgi:hypothetical protein
MLSRSGALRRGARAQPTALSPGRRRTEIDELALPLPRGADCGERRYVLIKNAKPSQRWQGF